MLNIDGGIYTDAGPQQFLHILISFGMPAAGSIAMGKLIYQQNGWTAL